MGSFIRYCFMSKSNATILRIAFALLALTAGLSAQRYTGHDHAVFHRQPQSPPPAAKHQSPSAGNAATTHQKASVSASASPQPTARTGASQGKLDVESNHNSP